MAYRDISNLKTVRVGSWRFFFFFTFFVFSVYGGRSVHFLSASCAQMNRETHECYVHTVSYWAFFRSVTGSRVPYPVNGLQAYRGDKHTKISMKIYLLWLRERYRVGYGRRMSELVLPYRKR
jgi:hypothetical protein